MATFTVTTLTDSLNATDGKLSLREALAQANAHANADTITFASSLEGKTIALTRGQLEITSDVTITGDPDHDGSGVTIDQRTDDLHEEADRVMFVEGSATDATLTGLTITGGGSFNYGDAVEGGGIMVACGAVLTLVDSIVAGNNGTWGGGIFGGGASISLLRTAVVGNSTYASEGYGAGIAITSGKLDVVQSTIAQNHADGDFGGAGGGIAAGFYFEGTTAQVSIRESTITGNRAGGEGGGDGGVLIGASSSLSISNSIVLGNSAENGLDGTYYDTDVSGITWSNGHNVLGVVGTGAAPGDVVGADAAKVFAGLDPLGGGRLVLAAGTWVAPLRDALDNPALSGADPATAGSADQRGVARPAPAGTAPDIGAYELNQTHVSHIGSTANDVLTGTAGANTLDGRAGNDLVSGLAGNDILRGSSGSDTLDGGAGDDRLDGGSGTDTASYATATAGITVDLATTAAQNTGGSGRDTLLSIENLTGSRFVDHLTGNSGANLLLGGDGGDTLSGNAGSDSLQGGGGNDILNGGLGRDVLTGGAGNDRFDFDAAADSLAGNADRILDFQGVGAATGDLVDLGGLPGALIFRGTGAFTGIGQVRVEGSGFDTMVQVNLTGSAAPEMEIRVQDGDVLPAQWIAGDFIL
ncbi:MAG: calcium-binding protein [Geminicoccaceae bacterium]